MMSKRHTMLHAMLLGALIFSLAACAAPAAPATEAPATEAAATEAATEEATEAAAEATTEAAATEAAAAPAGEAAAPADLEELIAAAQAEGELTTIALPHDWCNYGAVIEGFKAKYGLLSLIHIFAPIYLTMQLLGDLPGEQWGYAACPRCV